MNDGDQELYPQTLRDIQEIAKRLRFAIWEAEAAVEMMVAEGKGDTPLRKVFERVVARVESVMAELGSDVRVDLEELLEREDLPS